MCGILTGDGNTEFIKKRGIHLTETKINGIRFVHSLLPITGEFTEQPFVDGNIVCEYNGEIYNHVFSKSDGENLIPLYRDYGIKFPQQLDGEFAIALYDFDNDLALFITDPFGTKPLWRNGRFCASYESGVGGHQIPPNTVEGVKISTGEEMFSFNYHEWDWTQYKETYDDWIKAFERAIGKRSTYRCFIGLSSGYDSGAIAHELSKRGTLFKAYTVLNNENEKIIRERKKYCIEYEEVKVENKKLNIEKVPYKFCNEKTVVDDKGSLGLAAICEKAHAEGRRVLLSGQGADEIIGDYKFYPKQSNFQGVFPKKLREWENFNGGTQRDYLNKEEYVGGAFAIETRYPFLDRDLVQEFLWISPELKNRHYKAPIYEYLTRNNVPFEKDIKRGFNPL